jgi:putative RecB family exonuclease
MPLDLPTSLSLSKVSTFTDCALAFRFSAIDKLPEPPSVPATRGSLVHRALELLFCEHADARTREAADSALDQAIVEFKELDEFTGLALDEAAEQAFVTEARKMVGRYFELEDPRTITPIGIELRMEVQLGDLRLRGIIDRLELDDDGGLVVTDYKTGRVPSEQQERARLGGVHFYAFMCEQLFGKRPSKVQLMYLGGSPQMIVARPSDQSIRGLERKVTAIWSAVERACERDDFRPKPSKLCDWCAFKAYCPAFGGDPSAIPVPGAVELAPPEPVLRAAS